MFIWVKFGEVESPERRCFCVDVTCDNLLDAVKQTVEEETVRLIRRRDAELAIKLREAVLEEQQLAAKAARLQSLQEPTPPDISSGLELTRFRKTTLESNIEHLQANLVATRGLGLSSLDLVDPSSGALQKLANNPRKKATGLLRVGDTYEAARLEKNSTGAPASTPVMFSLSTAVTSQTTPP